MNLTKWKLRDGYNYLFNIFQLLNSLSLVETNSFLIILIASITKGEELFLFNILISIKSNPEVSSATIDIFFKGLLGCTIK